MPVLNLDENNRPNWKNLSNSILTPFLTKNTYIKKVICQGEN